MTDNYDPQLIIDYLKEQIADCEKWHEHWKQLYQYPESTEKMLICRGRKRAFLEVLEFIEETYKTDNDGK